MECARLQSSFMAIMLLIGMRGWAQEPKIVANPGLPISGISADELKSVFLLQKSSLRDGNRVEPVLQQAGSTHEGFVRAYLGKTDSALQTYYRSLVFTGKATMPKTVRTDSEVIAYVAQTRGAIGYVSPNSNAEGVKTLMILHLGEGTERALIYRSEAVYPNEMRQHHIGGTVRMRVTISPQGNVDDVELLGGSPALAQSAIEAVRQWRYAPFSSRTITEVSVTFDPSR